MNRKTEWEKEKKRPRRRLGQFDGTRARISRSIGATLKTSDKNSLSLYALSFSLE
jgi:hypothetical protein